MTEEFFPPLEWQIDAAHEITTDLQNAMDEKEHKNGSDHLKRQAKALNKIMTRMIFEANTEYSNDSKRMVHFGLALRAQNQYVRTILAANTLERHEAKQQKIDQDKLFEEQIIAAKESGTNLTKSFKSIRTNLTNQSCKKD